MLARELKRVKCVLEQLNLNAFWNLKLICKSFKVFLNQNLMFHNLFLSIIHHDTFVIEDTALPDNLIKSATGVDLLLQTLPQLAPIVSFSDKRIVENSQKIFNNHRNFYKFETPIMQVSR